MDRNAARACERNEQPKPILVKIAPDLDEQQLMDLVFTVGAYETIAMAFRSFGIELDEDLRK